MDEKVPIEYVCPRCEERFSFSQKLKKHMKKEHDETVSVCKSCPEIFSALNALFLHAREIHHKDKRLLKQDCKLQCIWEGCSYRTDNGGLLKLHVRSHNQKKPHVCAYCQKTFSQKSNMKTHYNRHFKTNVAFNCEPCDKEFQSYDIYLSHLGTREHDISARISTLDPKLKCMCCSEEFETRFDVFDHTPNCELSLMKGETISCTQCHSKMFPSLDSMKIHIMSHRNNLSCPLCDDYVKFDDRSKLNFHITKVHDQHVNRKSACRYCEQIFENIDEKNEHVLREHADMKNKHVSRGDYGRIQCSLCQTFTTNSLILLQKHATTVHNVDKCLYAGPDMPVVPTIDASKPKNRGRPRLIDQPFKPLENFQPIQQTIKEEKTRKRISNEVDTDIKVPKRGRPKTVKIEKQEPVNVDDMEYNYQNIIDYQYYGDVPELDENDYEEYFKEI